MALGLSEGGNQTAPLGRAVIGGLLLLHVRHSDVPARNLFDPSTESLYHFMSLNPDDPSSRYYEQPQHS